MQNHSDIWDRIEDKRDAFIALSDRVWGMPELKTAATCLQLKPIGQVQEPLTASVPLGVRTSWMD